MCGDGGALVGYLYGESEPHERALIEAHLAACAACTAELAALGATRSTLAGWAPPDAELGFQIVSARDSEKVVAQPATVLRPRQWWQRPLPAWAQVAAAIVIFSAGGLLGMRAGTTQPASPAVVASAPAAESSTTAVTASDLDALEQRLRREMTGLRTTTAAAEPTKVSATDEQLVARFRTMLEQSEERQRRELAFRLTQVMRDFDSQRRLDLAQIERTFGQIEGVTGPELRQQREAINYLIQRTSSQRPQ